MRHFFLALLFGLAPAASAMAQSGGDAVVDDMQQAYARFDYDEAESRGREALRRFSDFTTGQLTDIHTILGLVAYNRGDLRGSRREFTSALQLTPDLRLDPLLISPKIVDFFEEIKSDLAAGDASIEGVPGRYVLVRDRRTDAALRSMLLPGWGQFYKGHATKGWIASALFGATVTGAVAAHLKRRTAETAYTDESDSDLVAGRYDTFNRWHKARGGLIRGAAVIWAVAYVDALLTEAAFGPDQTRFALHASPGTLSVAVRF